MTVRVSLGVGLTVGRGRRQRYLRVTECLFPVERSKSQRQKAVKKANASTVY